MSKQTKSAKFKQCTIRIPQVCNFDPMTTVFAHLSGVRFGHGVGRKVNDIHGAYACSACHDAIDGRTPTGYRRNELKMMHLEGVIETQMQMIEEGLIKCE